MSTLNKPLKHHLACFKIMRNNRILQKTSIYDISLYFILTSNKQISRSEVELSVLPLGYCWVFKIAVASPENQWPL